MLSPRRALAFGVVSFLGLAACGDDGGVPGDGSRDGSRDGFVPPHDAMFVPVDIDNGSCGDQIRFTGEFVDWDFHDTSCGIASALFEVVPSGGMDSTAPNGRFDLCIPDQPTTRLTVTMPTANSQCTTPLSMYRLPVIAIARREVILGGGFWSGRAFTAARQASVFQGGAPDPQKGHVFVHIGAQLGASLSSAHGTPQALISGVAGIDWIEGTAGLDVFFPNVDVGPGTTSLTVDGGAFGTGDVPVVAGTITVIAVLPY